METQKTQPTESQIEVLMSDWLGNLRMKSEGNYTHKGKGGIHLKRKTSLQDYLLGDISGYDKLELMKQARMAAEKVINTVSPNPVAVQVGGSGSYNAITPDGRTVINLATDYFDDSIDDKEKVDIMLGLASHEGAHSAYTDQTLTDKYLEKEHEDLRELKHKVWNIIEDERIEYHLGEDRPGLVDNIAATKGYYFDRLTKKMKTEGKMPTEPLPKLLAAITLGVRYPSEMTREQVIENFDQLDEIRRTLTPYPLTPEEAWKAADRVMDIIRNTAKEEVKKQKEEQQQKESSGDGSKSDDKSQSGQPKGSNNNGEPSEQEIRDAIKKALSTKQGQNVMDAISNDTNKGDSDNKSNVLNVVTETYVNEDDSERMNSAGGYGNPDTFVRKPKGNPDIYNISLKKVRPYVPAMARALSCRSQEKDYTQLSQPRGKLDTNKFVAYKAGNENIFKKYGSVTCSKASVCMLIDESGSMSGVLKLAAREAAILVNEAIKRIKNVDFYCYGYTSAKLNVYSENGKTSPWALSDTTADSGTPTGKAMAMSARRVRKYTSDPVLMLVLTDGAADNSNLVIEQDRKLRTQKIIPVGVGILTNTVEMTFKDHITMTDISQFPFEMGRLTKGKLEKMLIRKDSND